MSVMADPRHATVRKQPHSVSFGFYTDEDVRARAVVECTSPQAIDAMGTPLPRGLYDSKMGPLDFGLGSGMVPCVTCAMPYALCPGHAGVIELCVPVYHPLLFGHLVKLMRAKCLACHKFRIPQMPMQVLETKFHLLHSGLPTAAQQVLELDLKLAQLSSSSIDLGSKKKRSHETDVSLESTMYTTLKEAQDACQRTTNSSSSSMTTLERQIFRGLRKEFLSSCMGAKKCSHCGAFSPKIRSDQSNKFFQSQVAPANARINKAEGIVLRPALSQIQQSQDDDDGDKDEIIHKDGSDDEATRIKDKNSSTAQDKFMHALEVEAQVKLTWKLHPKLCYFIFGGPSPESSSSSSHLLYKYDEGYQQYFCRAICVPPSRFRPPMHLGDMVVENAQNTSLNQMLILNDKIRTLLSGNTNDDDDDDDDNGGKKKLTPSNQQAMAIASWIDLQTAYNVYLDSSKDPRATASSANNHGIRQILERKEGIFRKHMMGKRVDFCCRSVISPDPYIGTDEIGIPLYFAEVLTFPTPVSKRNVVEMRNLVTRGSNYPGACWVQFGTHRLDLTKMDLLKRQGIAARLLSMIKQGMSPPIVGRQLRNGDMMLVNRQPTLHKPGIMAHYVRILHSPTQKTIRMHYANCNTYNADFDGDEMNCHFPQNYLAAAECKYIAATDFQYIVPTDGSPLRGLIQDHVDAGVKLTCKNTFLEKWEYQQLVFNALASLPGLEVIRLDQEIMLEPPAILKPKVRWTGKQVISTLLNHLRKGNDRDDVVGRMPEWPGISVEKKAKLSAMGFGEEQEEHLVLIRDGQLLRGILDKNAFGDAEFSLVHAVYESYGPHKAGLLLNALGRLLTAYLQHYAGHSCRMEDLLLTKEADEERRKLVERAYNVGARSAKAWADSEGGKVQIESAMDKPGAEIPLKPVESASAAAQIGQLLSGNEGADNFAALDGYMQSQLNPLASDIIKACLPRGLAVPFPENTFSLMVTTGAKGSIVNQSQISCALGQQALEGRRVPRLASGRTLPSFAPYDPSPRADGFIMDRFLTGIRPQEYYFHCMAGREGLVDTAVKTSRSGYLQRCLVKHLEELKVCYDNTVRNGEGAVIQFLYGEDGLDPTKSAFLDCSSTSFQYIARNHASLTRRNKPLPDASLSSASDDCRRIREVEAGEEDILRQGSFVQARRLRVGSRWVRGTLCRGWFDATITKINDDETFNLKYISDGKEVENVPLQVKLGRCGGKATPAASSTCTLIKVAIPDPILSGNKREDGVHRLGTSGKAISERVAEAASIAFKEDMEVKTAMKANGLSSKQMDALVASKYGTAMCHPGEAVGSIAAQSIGEPSTQMTLNTFHLAGAGANVTLGIPRLREIIMTASKVLKTPTMSVPLHDSVTDKQALRLTRFFSRLTLMELIASKNGIIVNETLFQGDGGNWERAYHITLKFHPAERMKEAFALDLEDIAKVISSSFQPKVAEIMKRELRRSSQEGDVASFEVQGGHLSDYATEKGDRGASLKSKEKEKTEKDQLDEVDEDEDDDDDPVGDEDGVNGKFNGKDEVEGYEDDDQEEDGGKNDFVDDEAMEGDDSDRESDEEDEESVEEEESHFYANMSNHPKLDRRNNSIHLPPLRVDPAARPLLMVGLVERAASVTLVRSRPKIEKGFINDEEDGRGRCLQTAGVNFPELWQLDDVDHDRLTSNDIWAVRCSYGVEAARNNIVESIKGVFKPYGISVDQRHLTLIADYMTFEGGYKAMNRVGMADISSPFLQMSFETTANFMTEAALSGQKEPIMSPSASIVMGRPIRHGTGAFDLLIT